MERNEISFHEVQIYHVIKSNQNKWLTNRQIGEKLSDISARTIRAHTRKFVILGLIDQAEVFPAHRYRWSEKGEKRNPAYHIRLQKASEVFGISD